MNSLFKLREVTIKDDIVNIYFEGNHNILAHILPHFELADKTTITVGSIVTSDGLTDGMIKAIDTMILQEDPTLFKNMLGEYTPCKTLPEWVNLLFNNIPLGVLSVELELKFSKTLVQKVIDMFAIEVEFHKELETRLKDL